jgi:hypothetical protein
VRSTFATATICKKVKQDNTWYPWRAINIPPSKEAKRDRAKLRDVLAIFVKLIHDATKRGIAINTISSHTSH